MPTGCRVQDLESFSSSSLEQRFVGSGENKVVDPAYGTDRPATGKLDGIQRAQGVIVEHLPSGVDHQRVHRLLRHSRKLGCQDHKGLCGVSRRELARPLTPPDGRMHLHARQCRDYLLGLR